MPRGRRGRASALIGGRPTAIHRCVRSSTCFASAIRISRLRQGRPEQHFAVPSEGRSRLPWNTGSSTRSIWLIYWQIEALGSKAAKRLT